MKNKKLLTGLTLALALVVVSSASVVFAATDEDFVPGEGLGHMFGQDLTDEERAELEAEMEERRVEAEARREEMEDLLDAGDYDAWVAYLEENGFGSNLLEVITEDNFDDFIAAHDLMDQAHDLMDDAREILSDLGVERGAGIGAGIGAGVGGRGGVGAGQKFGRNL